MLLSGALYDGSQVVRVLSLSVPRSMSGRPGVWQSNGTRCREPIVRVVVRTLLSLDSTHCWLVVRIGQPDGEAGASAWLLAGRRGGGSLSVVWPRWSRRWRGGRSNASSKRKKALDMGCRSEMEEARYQMRGGREDAGGQDSEKIREGKLL